LRREALKSFRRGLRRSQARHSSLIVFYMKEAGPFLPEEARFKGSERLSKMTLDVYATALNSTMVTWHGPKMV
jgi:hypothetical protein